MTRDEVIKLAEEYLRNVPIIKERIRLIDEILNSKCNDEGITKIIKQERHEIDFKMYRTIMAVSKLDNINQKIICFRYFDKLG